MATDSLNDGVDQVAPRYRMEGHIGIVVRRGQACETTNGWMRDISESGLAAFVAHELMLGETVTLNIALPDSLSLSLPAQVVRTEGTRYGFRFTALGAKERECITSAVASRPKIPWKHSEE